MRVSIDIHDPLVTRGSIPRCNTWRKRDDGSWYHRFQIAEVTFFTDRKDANALAAHLYMVANRLMARPDEAGCYDREAAGDPA